MSMIDPGVFSAIGNIATALGVISVLISIVTYAQTLIQRARQSRGRVGAGRSTPTRSLPQAPSREDTEVSRIRAAVRAELRDERTATFWSNFWTNLATNFVVGLIFFALGVIVGQAH